MCGKFTHCHVLQKAFIVNVLRVLISFLERQQSSLVSSFVHRLTAEEDECFDPATKGRLYRGQKNYTRSMRPCLHWTRVTHCLHHAFNSRCLHLHRKACLTSFATAQQWKTSRTRLTNIHSLSMTVCLVHW